MAAFMDAQDRLIGKLGPHVLPGRRQIGKLRQYVQLREDFFNDLGSGRPTLDPWGIGLDARRDETGLKITYQF